VTPQDELDRILARGRLSAPRRERIFEQVERAVRPTGSFLRSRYVLVAGPLALAAAVALMFKPWLGPPGGYSSKGKRTSSIETDCSGGELSACPRGSKLVFRVDGITTPVFFQAYAEPKGADGERVWYFPISGAPAPRIEPGVEPRTLEKGIVVGPEHVSGAYRVHVVLSTLPLSRPDVLRAEGANIAAVETIDMLVVDP